MKKVTDLKENECYQLTKNKIIQIAENVSLVKELFPDVFDKPLELNKWYKWKNKDLLFFAEKIVDFRIYYYGFYQGDFEKDWVHINNDFELATPEEVETALVNEAKRRGFEVGVKFENMNNKFIQTIISNPYFSEILNTLHIKSPKEDWDKGDSNPKIFDNGTWAKIIQTPNDVIKLIEVHGKDKLITLIEAYDGKN